MIECFRGLLHEPVGGASSINAGAWVRITPQVLAGWEAIGGSDWSVANLMKIYKKLERYTGKTANKHARGSHGPIKITQDPPASALSQKFTQAMILATALPLPKITTTLMFQLACRVRFNLPPWR